MKALHEPLTPRDSARVPAACLGGQGPAGAPAALRAPRAPFSGAAASGTRRRGPRALKPRGTTSGVGGGARQAQPNGQYHCGLLEGNPQGRVGRAQEQLEYGRRHQGAA